MWRNHAHRQIQFLESLLPRISDTAPLDISHATPIVSEGMAIVPAGPFKMGDPFWDEYENPDCAIHDGLFDHGERPIHRVYVSAFRIDQHMTTNLLWNEVYAWALQHGFCFDDTDSGKAGSGGAADHPVEDANWYEALKWCNARSEREGRVPAYYTDAAHREVYRSGEIALKSEWVKWDAGYRLPTEAEWEKAARGGLVGKRFPWGNTINPSQANYLSIMHTLDGWGYFAYDLSNDLATRTVYPVGHFPPNRYGLFDMAGNLQEWCWDWSDDYYYTRSPEINPRGPSAGDCRVVRGGSYKNYAFFCRCACRDHCPPDNYERHIGFRSVLGAVSSPATST